MDELTSNELAPPSLASLPLPSFPSVSSSLEMSKRTRSQSAVASPPPPPPPIASSSKRVKQEPADVKPKLEQEEVKPNVDRKPKIEPVEKKPKIEQEEDIKPNLPLVTVVSDNYLNALERQDLRSLLLSAAKLSPSVNALLTTSVASLAPLITGEGKAKTFKTHLASFRTLLDAEDESLT